MEYADGGTLRSYLKEKFSNLTWDDKFKLALQLSYAILCLHDEKIVHRDLVIHLVYFQYYVQFMIYMLNNFCFNYSTLIIY